MSKSDLVLDDREIIPITQRSFGVVVTEQEAIRLLRDGYNVRTVPRTENEDVQYYIKVHIGSYQVDSVDLPMMETAGKADVVIHPVPWTIGNRSGVKAYVMSANVRT